HRRGVANGPGDRGDRTDQHCPRPRAAGSPGQGSRRRPTDGGGQDSPGPAGRAKMTTQRVSIPMNPDRDHCLLLTRRQLFGATAPGIGASALASLLGSEAASGSNPHFAARAKNVIYLFMSGGPSHIDLFDYKPKLQQYHGQELPASIRMGQRITGMTA